jgi:hypothetical protein
VRTTMTTAIVGVLIAFGAAEAQSACAVDGSDLKGRWTFQLSTSVSGRLHGQQCLNVGVRGGEFRAARCETIRLSETTGMEVDRRCNFATNLFVTLPSGTELGCQLRGTLNRDHEMFAGHILCVADVGTPPSWVAAGVRN